MNGRSRSSTTAGARLARLVLAPALVLVVLTPAVAGAHDIVYLSDARRAPASEFFVAESEASATIHTTRCCHASYPTSVDISSRPGTAASGEDYTDRSETLRFASATGIAAFEIPFADDNAEEALETVAVRLSEPGQGTTIAGGGRGVLTIVDDDGDPRVAFGRSSYNTFENLGRVQLIVVRAGDASAPASVGYATVDGTATAGEDYEAASETVEFQSGQRVRRIELTTRDDADQEGTESFTVELTPSQGAALAPADATTSEVVLQDDETPTSDTVAPVSYFHQPLHDTTYRPRAMRDVLAFAEDDGVGVKAVQVALVMKRRGGGCRWFDRSERGFVAGDCATKRWMRFSTSETMVYTLPDPLRRSIGTRIRFYKAWSRGIDELGNVERAFRSGRNRVRFEIR
ncbi:MAG TPA: Calx-beta domain-containing protein [Actinomycetota bacterium]|nr:Calx-beta domain-containing protein [Actinomycetota bacterium]